MQARRWWTLFAVLVCLLAATGAADKLSDRYAAEALERAFVTWAVARGLNSVISVAQGTELALEPGGVGVNLTVGQVLDPVNDLIEQFSSVMLAATSAIALQNLLLKITGSLGVSIFLAATALSVIAVLWIPRFAHRTRLRAFVLRFFLISFTIRFALPVLIVGSHFIFNQFLQPQQEQATEALRVASMEIEAISEEAESSVPDDRSMFERFGDMVDESLQNLNVRERLNQLKERASGASRHVVNLIVIFMLQTILLPIAFLWLMLQAMKSLATRAIQ